MDSERESQESRDCRYRSVKGYRSNATPIEKLENLRQVWKLIWDLENHGPVGLIHLIALAYVTGTSIRIWDSDHEHKADSINASELRQETIKQLKRSVRLLYICFNNGVRKTFRE